MPSGEFDPAAILMRFAEGLPATIRDIVLARCNLAFGHHKRMMPDSEESQLDIFRSLFTAKHAVDRGYEIAKICGVLELAVEFDEDHEQFTESLAAKHPEIESFATYAAQAPLKTRHFEQAHAQFAELRSGPLSPRVLHVWQRVQMGKERFG